MTARKSRSKAETHEALSEVARAAKAREALSTKETEAVRTRNEGVRAKTANLSIDSAVTEVTNLGLSISKSLAGLNEKLIAEVTELEAVRAAVALEKEELERLHGVDIVASSIDDLLVEHSLKKKSIEDEMARIREETDREKARLEKEQEDYDDEQRKAHEREESEYRYGLEQSRRSDTDAFEMSIREKRKLEADRKEQLEKDWRNREEILAKQETDLFELRKKVEEFPATLEKEKKTAEAIVGNSIKREYEHQLALLRKDMQTAQTVSESAIASLKDQNQKLAAELAATYTRLAETDKKVQSIAEKALEAASGRQALTEIQSFSGRENGSAGTRSKA